MGVPDSLDPYENSTKELNIFYTGFWVLDFAISILPSTVGGGFVPGPKEELTDPQLNFRAATCRK